MSKSEKVKIFKDPVHGYIYVKEDIVDLIIDTEYFQRLRRIEQTSMRCVYPSARHDRFAHSLGTYFLSKIATGAVVKAILKSNIVNDAIDLEALAYNFEMAALLHDVGHSPMSHTLEKFFEQSEDINSKLVSLVDDNNFKKDFNNVRPSTHEIVSSIVICECFKKTLEILCDNRDYIFDLEFIVRCIIGATYCEEVSNKYYKNALIRLLNSGAIDVDKLDYVKRDSIVSGYDNISVDTNRLLNSLTVVPLNSKRSDAFTLAFGKSALSVIRNVVDCRNMLYTWIYGHHKVVYESDYLINKAVNKLITIEPQILTELFSVNAIIKDLCCDDDVWVMLKKHSEIQEVAELLNRQKHRTALWKTKVEFDLLFPHNEKAIAIGDFDVSQMIRAIDAWREGLDDYEKFHEYIDAEYSDVGKSKVAIFIKPKVKVSAIRPNDVNVYIYGKLYQYTSLDMVAEKMRDSAYAYVYIDDTALKKEYANSLINKKTEFIQQFADYIKKYPKFCLLPDYENP